MKTVLVVDDHPIVLEGIFSVLTSNGFKVLKATSAKQAETIIENIANIDILVADLSLKEGTDGLDFIEEQRRRGFRKPTVIYTMHEELWNISMLMNADVEGIVLKGDNIRELVYAIKTVADGCRYVSSSFDARRREAINTGGILSSKDIEVLRRLSSGESNKIIAMAMGISEKAIEYHRSNILRKLNVKTMIEATKKAISLGIIYVTVIIAIIVMAVEVRADVAPRPVDLGLSVLWSDMNLGAESPLESGDFFAFGETEPKDYYDWFTYAHCRGEIGTCLDIGSNISGTENDAAHVILKNGWRIPTLEECDELLEKCGVESLQEGDFLLKKFTGSNGNYIIFPICGYMSLDKMVCVNKEGCYATATCEYEEYSGEGWSHLGNYCMMMSKNESFTGYGSPHLGLPIRAVKNRDSEDSALQTVPDSSLKIINLYTIAGMPLSSVSLSEIPPGLYVARYSDLSVRKILITSPHK